MRSLDGKVAVVTGASSGLGRELAIQLAEAGTHLSLCDRDSAGLRTTAEIARSFGVDVHSALVDVSDRDEMFTFAADVAAHHGSVNLVFNNAGIAHYASVIDTEFADYHRMMDIDFWGVVNGTKAFLPHLISSGDGHLVNTSSIFGVIASGRQSAYTAAKFAVRGFTESLRIEMLSERRPVRVTCAVPGGLKTPFGRHTTASGQDPATVAAFFEKYMARTEVDSAAATIIRGVRRDKPTILVGPDAAALYALSRVGGSGYQRVGALIDRNLWRFMATAVQPERSRSVRLSRRRGTRDLPRGSDHLP